MPVLDTLNAGNDSTAYTHTNPLVETIHNERQAERNVTYSAERISYKEEWLGTSEEIHDLLCSKVPNLQTYGWDENEQWSIDRQRGDLSKLTHTWDIVYETVDEASGGSVSDPIEENLGITPWTIKTETTDIGAIDYYILKFKLDDAKIKEIKRERIALWEQSPYEQKEEYKYRSQLNGWQTVDKDTTGNVDSPISLEIVKWIVEQSRSQFPLTTVRVTHEEIVKGPSYKNGKINKTSLSAELTNSAISAASSPLAFPSHQLTKELSAIPNCPYSFDFSYPTSYMLVDWGVTVKEPTGKYLVTKEYISYPTAFPLPLDATPGDGSDDE